MSNFDKEKIVLPPPPTKPKLKSMHTFSGTGNVCSNNNRTDTNTNPNPVESFKPVHNNKQLQSTNSLPNEPRSFVSFKSFQSSFQIPTNTIDNSKFCSSTDDNANLDDDLFMDDIWAINDEQFSYYKKQFSSLTKDSQGHISGLVAKTFFEKSGLEIKYLSNIWKLSDLDQDGALSLSEFCIAMHLVVLCRNQIELPQTLPNQLKQSIQYYHGTSTSNTELNKPIASDFNPESTMMDLSEFDTNPLNSWTRFNDSPILIDNSKSSSVNTSPTKLVNFDYDADYIASNPNIKHPVPLRLSPISYKQLMYNSKKSSLTSFTSSNSINSAIELFSNSPISKDSPNDLQDRSNVFFPNYPDESKKISPILSSTKNIVDYIENLENRFSQMKLDINNQSSFKKINPSDTNAKIDELNQEIRSLKETNQTLTRYNQEMHQEMGNLMKIIQHLINDSKKWQ